MNKKVTELNEAKEIKDEDLIMIIQNNENKKTQLEAILANFKLAIYPVRFYLHVS